MAVSNHARGRKALSPPGVLVLIALFIPGLGRAELYARQRFQDPSRDGETPLPPALGLGTLQHIIGDQSDVRGRPHLAGQLAGQVQALATMSSVPPEVNSPLNTARGI